MRCKTRPVGLLVFFLLFLVLVLCLSDRRTHTPPSLAAVVAVTGGGAATGDEKAVCVCMYVGIEVRTRGIERGDDSFVALLGGWVVEARVLLLRRVLLLSLYFTLATFFITSFSATAYNRHITHKQHIHKGVLLGI